MQDFACSSLNTGDTTTLIDSRDNNVYNVARLADNKCWMLDNLAFNGKSNKGNGSYITMNSSNTNLASGTETWDDTVRTGWTSSSQNSYIASYINDTYKDTVTSDSTADILLDGVEYEMKSPFTSKPDKLERNIKRGLKQAKNIIFDSSRIKGMRDDSLRRFLIKKAKEQKQIGRLLFITKRGKVIDIKSLI